EAWGSVGGARAALPGRAIRLRPPREDVASGLSVRTDWGPQYTAHAFGAELRWLGIQHSPSFVGEPQCNGGIERFMRTLSSACGCTASKISPMPSERSGHSSSATNRNG